MQGNQLPQCSPPHLYGETTVTLTPGGIVRGPLVMSPYQTWDPDGDEVTVHWGDLSPVYAQQISLFLGSLVMLYWPDAADEHCRAVRKKDVLVDQFTITLRDTCGAETEVPVTVVIRVNDKVPPTIFRPAQSRTVECDGAGDGRPNLQDYRLFSTELPLRGRTRVSAARWGKMAVGAKG